MEMIKVEDGEISFKIKIKAYLNHNDKRSEISLSEAIQIAKEQLEQYASSNDGSEVLANAKPIFD